MYDGMIATAASKTSSNISAVINTVISNLHLYRRHVYLNSYFSYILVVSDFQSRLGNLFYLRICKFQNFGIKWLRSRLQPIRFINFVLPSSPFSYPNFRTAESAQ